MNYLAKAKNRFKYRYKLNSNGCWIWDRISKQGYGTFNFLNTSWAHRASYMIFIGKIPKGLVVAHSCDNKACVNPKHLFLATQEENIRDSILKGRNIRGGFSKKSKLKKTDVLAIRALAKTQKFNQCLIAGLFNTRQQNISKIINHKKWKDLI